MRRLLMLLWDRSEGAPRFLWRFGIYSLGLWVYILIVPLAAVNLISIVYLPELTMFTYGDIIAFWLVFYGVCLVCFGLFKAFGKLLFELNKGLQGRKPFRRELPNVGEPELKI